MEIAQLPEQAQRRLDELLEAVMTSLSASNSQHLTAISDSSMENGSSADAALTGGQLRAPAKPPFRYDKASLGRLHRAVYEAADGSLYGLVIRCRRGNAELPWSCAIRLISRAEHAAIVAARQPLDDRMHSALARLTLHPDWERVSFGRDMPGKAPELIRKRGSTGLERSAPDADLLALLRDTEHLYGEHGLSLQIAFWTLRPDGMEFREYYE